MFYRNGDKMMVVDVETGSRFKAGTPRVLFAGKFDRVVWGEPNYDVSPDGRAFLMVRSQAPTPVSKLQLVVNWFAELRASRR